MMSGIFKYNPSSPLRRSGVTPFCTSPSQLQDVTMDNSNVLGFRSPPNTTGYGDNSSSPGQGGRSLREYEEQMTALRKENFNLKLRIYFLEEKNPISIQSPDGSESLFKQNVDLKVEIESLRKELQEKQDLLCQAAKALELMEDSQKTNNEQSQEKIDELQKKIQFLEMEIETLDIGQIHQHNQNDKIFSDPEAHHKFLEQETIIKNCQLKMFDLTNKLENLDSQIKEKNHKIKELETRFNEVSYENFELKERIEESDKGILDNEGKLRNQIYEYKKEIADKTCSLQDAEDQLIEKSVKYDKACVTIQQLLSKIKEKQHELDCLKLNGNDEDSLENAYNIDKDKELINLRENLKQRTISLHNIVNKELRDKFNTLETLRELFDKDKNFQLPLSLQLPLARTFNEHQLREAIEQNDKLQMQLDDVINKLHDQKRESETEKACIEIEKSDQNITWQRSCMNVCKILTQHVEELAEFLDSLLSVRNLTQHLDTDQTDIIRETIDRSLDLSRNLMSLSIIDQTTIDQSLIYFNSLNDILENSHCDSFNKVLSKQLDLNETRKKCEEKNRRSINTIKLQNDLIDIDADDETDDDFNNIGCTSNDNIVNGNEPKVSLRSKEMSKLKGLLKKRENSLHIAESTIKDVDKDRLKFIDIAKKLKDLLKVRKMAHEKTLKDFDELRKKLTDKVRIIGELESEKEKIKIDLRVAETKLLTSKSDFDELKEKHRKQIENLRNQIAEMEIFKMEIEEKFNSDILRKENEMKETITKSWVTRIIYEKQENELHDTRNRLGETNHKLNEYEKQMDELKQQITTYEMNSRKLKKNLDDSTMQCSKIALERTKALNEKSIAEGDIKNLQTELDRICLEKNNLNIKISELEKTTEILQNKFTTTDIKCLPLDDLKIETKDKIIKQNDNSNDSKLDVIVHDCQQIEKENIELKQKLVKTRRALEETWTKLKTSNQRKEQIERNIRQQVGQTHSVLKNVRTLMENNNSVGGGGSGDDKEHLIEQNGDEKENNNLIN